MIIINFLVNLSVFVIYAAINAVQSGEILEITITSDDWINFTAQNHAIPPTPPNMPLNYNFGIYFLG